MAGSWLRAPAAVGLLGTLALIVVLLPLRWAGALQSLELAAYDRMVEWRGAGGGEERRIVEIDATEADISRFRWPLPDGVLADVITRLRGDGARAIGIDIFRDTPIAPGSETLAAALHDMPEVVWIDRPGVPAPAAAQKTGYPEFIQDRDGGVRRAALLVDREPALGLFLAVLYLTADKLPIRVDAAGHYWLGSVGLAPMTTDLGAYRGINTNGFQILFEYRAPLRIPRYSIGDLIDGKVPAAAIANRIAMVGVVAETVKDSFIAPVGAAGSISVPGPTLHALLASQLLAHGLDGLPQTRPLSRRAEFAMLLGVLIAGGLAGTFVQGMFSLFFVLFGGAAALLAGSCLAFLNAIWLPAALLPGFWVLAIVVSKTAMSQAEATQRAFLMRLFSTHMAAPIAKDMWRRRNDFLRHGRPLPVRLNATVLFSDVNDFTTISEKLEPEEIVRWLEPYMIAMVNLIDAHGGCVERFSGDGILAMFGVPIRRETDAEIRADAAAAVRCARGMAEAIVKLNAGYRANGQSEIKFAVGIQSGELVSCSLGSNDRLQYTTMGDTTNTAARFVNVAKDEMKRPGAAAPCCIVIGGATAALLDEDAFGLRPLGPVDLKGKARRTECFAVEDAPPPAAKSFATAAKYGSVVGA